MRTEFILAGSADVQRPLLTVVGYRAQRPDPATALRAQHAPSGNGPGDGASGGGNGGGSSDDPSRYLVGSPRRWSPLQLVGWAGVAAALATLLTRCGGTDAVPIDGGTGTDLPPAPDASGGDGSPDATIDTAPTEDVEPGDAPPPVDVPSDVDADEDDTEVDTRETADADTSESPTDADAATPDDDGNAGDDGDPAETDVVGEIPATWPAATPLPSDGIVALCLYKEGVTEYEAKAEAETRLRQSPAEGTIPTSDLYYFADWEDFAAGKDPFTGAALETLCIPFHPTTEPDPAIAKIIPGVLSPLEEIQCGEIAPPPPELDLSKIHTLVIQPPLLPKGTTWMFDPQVAGFSTYYLFAQTEAPFALWLDRRFGANNNINCSDHLTASEPIINPPEPEPEIGPEQDDADIVEPPPDVAEPAEEVVEPSPDVAEPAEEIVEPPPDVPPDIPPDVPPDVPPVEDVPVADEVTPPPPWPPVTWPATPITGALAALCLTDPLGQPGDFLPVEAQTTALQYNPADPVVGVQFLYFATADDFTTATYQSTGEPLANYCRPLAVPTKTKDDLWGEDYCEELKTNAPALSLEDVSYLTYDPAISDPTYGIVFYLGNAEADQTLIIKHACGPEENIDTYGLWLPTPPKNCVYDFMTQEKFPGTCGPQ